MWCVSKSFYQLEKVDTNFVFASSGGGSTSHTKNMHVDGGIVKWHSPLLENIFRFQFLTLMISFWSFHSSSFRNLFVVGFLFILIPICTSSELFCRQLSMKSMPSFCVIFLCWTSFCLSFFLLSFFFLRLSLTCPVFPLSYSVQKCGHAATNRGC